MPIISDDPSYIRKHRKHHNHYTSHCAPGRGGDGVSCFSTEELIQIANRWNEVIEQRKMGHVADGSREQSHQNPLYSTPPCLQEPIRVTTRTPRYALWNAINERMQASTKCCNERCWVTVLPSFGKLPCANGQESPHTDIFFEELLHTAFRPEMPQSWYTNPTEWLSTTDIDRVMKQYEALDRTFRFVGAVPIDFASPSDNGTIGRCVTQALCNVRLKNWWNDGVRHVGIVFNLDAHDEPGSHWVSAYLDLKGNGLYYYDSFGAGPPVEVQRLFAAVGAQLELIHEKPPHEEHNNIRHQFKNTECGVYSILFLVTMVEAAERNMDSASSYKQFIESAFNDSQVQRWRDVFFENLQPRNVSVMSIPSPSNVFIPPIQNIAGGGKVLQKNRSRKSRTPNIVINRRSSLIRNKQKKHRNIKELKTVSKRTSRSNTKLNVYASMYRSRSRTRSLPKCKVQNEGLKTL